MSGPDAGRLAGIQVGRARTHARPDWDRARSRTWISAYQKLPVTGPVKVSRTQVEGDEHVDQPAHGGTEMAALAYSAGHYPHWREELGLEGFGPGAFGENLTIEGFEERGISIGDVFEVGDVRVQISNPRGPCANISRFWGREDLLKRVTESGRTGWYLRVLREGTIEAGMPVTRVERPQPEWTVERVFRARVDPHADLGDVAKLTELPLLSEEWRGKFRTKLAKLAR